MSYAKHCGEAKDIKARCAVVTLSDSRKREDDTSGKKIEELLAGAGHKVAEYRIIRDDPEVLGTLLTELLGLCDLDVVITNGGTGVSKRDRTIEVVEPLLEIHLPGFGELFRMLSWEQVKSGALLSRAVGGVARGKLLFALPGSTAAVELAVSKLIVPEIGHLLFQLRKFE
jgi:molybdenum cofactor biosynthesis protein B